MKTRLCRATARQAKKEKKETMKKLIIAAAIVCAAAFANAASAVWGVGYINDVDGNPLGASSTGYTATLNIYIDSSLATLVTSASVSDWDGGFADGGETASVLDNSVDTTYYGQIVITHGSDTIKSDGFQFTTSTFFDQTDVFIMTASDEVTVEKIGGGDFDGTNGAFETNGGGGWSSVPEPTSGLLLLLGVAGLALRRKHA